MADARGLRGHRFASGLKRAPLRGRVTPNQGVDRIRELRLCGMKTKARNTAFWPSISPRSSARFDAPSGAAVGDLRIDADVRIVGANDSPFKLALGAAFYAPTGSPSQYTGDGRRRFFAARARRRRGRLVRLYAASLGLMIDADDGTLAGNPMGDALFGGLVGARVFDKHLTMGPENDGRTD